MQLKTLFMAGAATFGLLAAGVGGLTWTAIEHVRIGGHAYRAIIRDKDLVADALPPPA